MGGNKNLGLDLDFFDLLERKNCFNPGREECSSYHQYPISHYVCGIAVALLLITYLRAANNR
jgi:hypothetical protein